MHPCPEKLKPSFTQKLKYQSVLVGEPVVFQCKLSAYPSPHITWFHNNNQILQSLQRIIKNENCLDMHSSCLEVQDVQEGDAGSYKVFAINSEGSAESTASLLVAYGKKQNAKYLEFLRKSESTHEHIEHLMQKKRADRLKVDLRCIGSPFDKRQETETALTNLSPGKGKVRTISFENIQSLRQEFLYDNDRVRKRDLVSGESETEALLDEEIRLKLQRLREAKRIILEKKKLHPSQASARVERVKIVGFRDNRNPSAHSLCMASEEGANRPVFQTIEQINKKTMSNTQEFTIESSIEKTSEKFHVRVKPILSHSKPFQAPQESANISNTVKIPQNLFGESMEPEVSEPVSMMGYTDTQEKSLETKTDTKFQEHAESFINIKSVQKISSSLIDDIRKTQKSEMLMSEAITSNINESTAVCDNRRLSKGTESERSVNQSTFDVVTDIKKPNVPFRSPQQQHLAPCPPFFIQEIESQEVSEGESCTFSCAFQAYPYITIAWYNNDKSLSHSPECTIHSTRNNSVLAFSTVSRNQEGSVTCVIFNQYGTAASSGLLRVKVKEMPESEPCNVCKVELLPCYAEEEEELSLAFDSMKEEEPVLNVPVKATLLLPQVHLPQPSISKIDHLSFPLEIKVTAPTPIPELEEFRETIPPVECESKNLPEEQPSKGVRHKFKFSFDVVHEPPKLIKKFQPRIKCKEGDSVVLECSIATESQAAITWFHNNQPLRSNENIFFEEGDSIYGLHICKVSTSDAGAYKCVAVNSAGFVETACNLLVSPTDEQTDIKASQSHVKGIQRKEDHYNYFESSVGQMESKLHVKEHWVSPDIHDISILDFKDNKTCTLSNDTKAREKELYLNDIMKSLLTDENESPDFQIPYQKEISNKLDSKEDKVAIIPELETYCVNKVRDTSVEQDKFKVGKIDKCAARETSSPQIDTPALRQETDRSKGIGETDSVNQLDSYTVSFYKKATFQKQKEVVVKDISAFEVPVSKSDKIIKNVKGDSLEDIYKEREQRLDKSALKQLSSHVKTSSQNLEDVAPQVPYFGFEINKANVEKTMEMAQKCTSYREHETVFIPSNQQTEASTQEQTDIQEEAMQVKDYYSVYPDIKMGERYFKSTESMETKIIDKSQRPPDLEELFEQGFPKVNEHIKQECNREQQSLPSKHDIFDLKQIYTEVKNNIEFGAAQDMTDKSQECDFLENEAIHLKLAFLNNEYVDQQPEEKLSQPHLYLSSASKGLEALQQQKLIITQEVSNVSQQKGSLSQEIELSTQEVVFDLKGHAASFLPECLLKETEASHKEETCSFNQRSTSVADSESFTKQLEGKRVTGEGISLHEESGQSSIRQKEGSNATEHELTREAEMSVTQILKMTLENPDIPAGHWEHQQKISERNLLRTPDEAFKRGPSEPTPDNQYFQTIMKETSTPEHIHTAGIVAPEADSFVSDMKKAALEKVSPNVHQTEEEKTPLGEHSFTEKVRDFSLENLNKAKVTFTHSMTEKQHSDLQEPSGTPATEPSISQFLLSLKNESLVGQRETGMVSNFEEQELSSEHLTEGQQHSEFVRPFLRKENEGVALPAQESQDSPDEGTAFSFMKYLLVAGKKERPDVKERSPNLVTREGSITSLEVEDVTFSAVYDYYNQPQELSRPFSPESEMSINIDGMNGDEIIENEGFYTPPSSVENFESPTSFTSYYTPVGTPEQYSTPSEDRYFTPSEERYSTPSEERYSTPSQERYSTPSEERYSTPSEERYSTPSEDSTLNSGVSPTKLARKNASPAHYQTPIGFLLQQRSSSLDEACAEMFCTPCEALEPQGNEMPPVFIKPLAKRKIYENTTLYFIAEVIGTPVPNVKWYKNKSLLEQDPRVKIQKEGNMCRLEINNIQKTDEGEYMCHAVNIIGEARSIAKVEVWPHDGRALALPPPVTHQHVIEFDLEKGSASRTPSPQEIVLEVDLDETVVTECEKQVKIATIPELTSDKSMIVSLDVLPSSMVENTQVLSGKEYKDVKIDFKVTEMPPSFITPVSYTLVPKKSEAYFHCKVLGYPTPVINWFKGSKCLAPNTCKYAITSENVNYSLKIQNVVQSDQGMYLCKAVNTVGAAICKCFFSTTECQKPLAIASEEGKIEAGLDMPQNIDLLVDNTIPSHNQPEADLEFEKFKHDLADSQVRDVPPKFRKNIYDCFAFAGTSAYFQCIVGGSPKPTITWFKNGILISEERFHMEERQKGCHSLIIRNVVQSDEGEYKCVATNTTGIAHSTALLKIC